MGHLREIVPPMLVAFLYLHFLKHPTEINDLHEVMLARFAKISYEMFVVFLRNDRKHALV